jgi:hypothetical protein
MMRTHGHFILKQENNLLFSYFFGAWNIEQTLTYIEQVKRSVQTCKKQPWARIVDLSQWEGAGEEVTKPLTDLQCWSEHNNCVQTLYINPPLIPKYMLEKHGNPDARTHIVQTENEAIQWLKANTKLITD